jgi:hypothetical protein
VRVLYCLDRSTMTNASPMLPISRPATLAIPDASMSVVMALLPVFRTSTASATVAVITTTSRKKLAASNEPAMIVRARARRRAFYGLDCRTRARLAGSRQR